MKVRIIDNRTKLVYVADDARELASTIWGLVSNQRGCCLNIEEIRK